MGWGGHDGEQGSASGARRIGQGKRVGERPGCMMTAGMCERVCPGGKRRTELWQSNGGGWERQDEFVQDEDDEAVE